MDVVDERVLVEPVEDLELANLASESVLYPPSSRPQSAFTWIATFSKSRDEERASSYICHSSEVMLDELTR